MIAKLKTLGALSSEQGTYLRTVTCKGIRGVIVGYGESARLTWDRAVIYFFNLANAQ